MKAHKAVVELGQWCWRLGIHAAAACGEGAGCAGARDAQTPQVSQMTRKMPISQDPPSRVARLNYLEGSVSFQPGGENDWVTAVLNRPLVTGDNLWADEDSRAEVHIGSTALRLGPKTGITLLEVSDRSRADSTGAGILDREGPARG